MREARATSAAWRILYEELNRLVAQMRAGDSAAHVEVDNLLEEVLRLHHNIVCWRNERFKR